MLLQKAFRQLFGSFSGFSGSPGNGSVGQMGGDGMECGIVVVGGFKLQIVGGFKLQIMGGAGIQTSKVTKVATTGTAITQKRKDFPKASSCISATLIQV